MRRGAARFVFAAAMVAAIACSTEPDVSHVGAYQLHTINGLPLPQPRGTLSETVGGSVVLHREGTFFDSTAVRVLSTGEVIGLVGIGVYRRSGDEIEFIPLAGDHTYTMTYSAGDGTLTQQVSAGQLFVYKR
jgi:hypothetical protein